MPDVVRARVPALLMGAAIVLSGCGGDGAGGPNGVTAVAKSSSSGDAQAGLAGQPLANPIQVVVTQDGNPAPGVTVTWTSSEPGAVLTPSSGPTDASGLASSTWTLGSTVGSQTAEAAASGATGSPVSFTATAVADLPPAPATADVTVRNNNFLSVRNSTSNPAVDTVAVGGTVTWTWAPTATSPHDVTSTGSPGFTGQPTLVQPPPFSVTFSAAGTYDYYCTQHGQPTSGMRGRIVVR